MLDGSSPVGAKLSSRIVQPASIDISSRIATIVGRMGSPPHVPLENPEPQVRVPVDVPEMLPAAGHEQARMMKRGHDHATLLQARHRSLIWWRAALAGASQESGNTQMDRNSMALYVPEAFPQGAKDLLGRLSETIQGPGQAFTSEDIILAGCTIAANVIAQSTSTAEQRQAGIASAMRIMESVIDDVVGIARIIAEERLGRPLTAQERGEEPPLKAPD